jgi:putative transposase
VSRSDAGRRKTSSDIVELVEGLALRKPRLSAAAIHRKVADIARERDWSAPSYATVHGIIRALDPAIVTLAQDGPAAWRDRYELIHRHRAERPNAVWQADHTMLDIEVLGADGKPERPWLTVVMDDYSRAIAGYTVFIGAPSASNLSLALRQAIWRKSDITWPVCGIPDILHVDHGSDFTSTHMEQVAVQLHMRIVYSTVGRPQGRGKVERFFGTLNTELLSTLPGRIEGGVPGKPVLTLPELDAAIGAWITGTYHNRPHSQIGTRPVAAWIAEGWLPHMPESLAELDLLLVTVAKSRLIRRDGIRLMGLRYTSTELAPFVGEYVTVRYDPRDLAEIRVFLKNRFLCSAICPDLATEAVTLADIQAARIARRRALRRGIDGHAARLADLLREGADAKASARKPPSEPERRLRLYQEDD